MCKLYSYTSKAMLVELLLGFLNNLNMYYKSGSSYSLFKHQKYIIFLKVQKGFYFLHNWGLWNELSSSGRSKWLERAREANWLGTFIVVRGWPCVKISIGRQESGCFESPSGAKGGTLGLPSLPRCWTRRGRHEASKLFTVKHQNRV